jgi:hypothetical protein
MESLADRLPPELAQHVHPDWKKNEAGYWACRESLLGQYRNCWVGFADGHVLVSGRTPVDVFHESQRSGRHPFVTCVGREHEPCRIRRAVFSYDAAYPGEPLPLIEAEFRRDAQEVGVALDRVIPDTGADATVLPWSDCLQLQLDLSTGVPGWMGGVGQSAEPTLTYSVWVYLDGRCFRCQLQADFTGGDRILGRDVLNKIDVLFRGPTGEVIVSP